LLYYLDLGEYTKGSEIRERALRLDPLSKPAILNYLGLLYLRGRLDEIRREIDKIRFIYPDIYAGFSGNIAMASGQVSQRALGFLDAMKAVGSLTRTSRGGLSYSFAYMGLQNEALALFDTPPPYLLSILGRHEEAVAAAEARVAENPTSTSNLRDLGSALADSGDNSRAMPVLENLWQKSGLRVTLSGTFQVRSAMALIIVRQESNTGIEDILTATDDNIDRLRRAGFTRTANLYEGYFAYLGGERARGLELIAEEVENGRFLRLTQARYRFVHDDPGFTRILNMQQERSDLERQKFLNVVCNDNPYSAVWQPSTGTCTP
jgi:tetratricopeptide (TPR) repeat protein